jgi:hypothetical protein
MDDAFKVGGNTEDAMYAGVDACERQLERFGVAFQGVGGGRTGASYDGTLIAGSARADCTCGLGRQFVPASGQALPGQSVGRHQAAPLDRLLARSAAASWLFGHVSRA